jgi:predicted MFS family arabinose efflux permease
MSMAQAEGDRPLFSRAYLRWLLLLLFLITTSASMDRTILAALGQAIKADLKLSDLELGALGGLSFAIFYSLAGLPIARLADRASRVRILAVATALWSAMTALSGTASLYWQLFLCRMGVGVGEAAQLPCSYPLIADHFPKEKRGRAIALVTLGVPAGSLIGAVGGGLIAQHFHWRWAFVAAGAPGLLLAALVFLTLREPPRGHADGGAAPPARTPFLVALRTLLAKASYRHLVIGSTLTVFVTNGMFQFIVPFLVRNFHLPYGEAGRLFGVVSGLAAGAGTLAGGYFSDWAGKRDRRWYVWTCAVGLILACPCYLLALQQPSAAAATAAFGVGATLHFLYAGPSVAAIQTLAPPQMRSSAAAVTSLGTILIGSGCGPVVIGFFSDRLAARAFRLGDYLALCPGGTAPRGAAESLAAACRQASATGVKEAMVIAAAACVWAALHFALAGRSLRRDLDALR